METKPIRILHWINLTRLYRCHLTFENTPEVTHYYLTDKARNVLKHKPNVFVGGVRNSSFIQKVLDQVKPDAIICSNLIQRNLMKLMKENCRYFVYIPHTLWPDETIELKIKNAKAEKTKLNYSIFDRLYYRSKEMVMWKTIGIPEEKIKLVHGVTYMDNVRTSNTPEQKIRMMKKFFPKLKSLTDPEILKLQSLVLVHNNTLTGCLFPNGKPKNIVHNSDEYGIMLDEMVKYATEDADQDCYVFAKIGRRSNTLKETSLIRKLHQHPRVAVIRPETDYLLSDFIFADVIINQSYSAAYQECLIAKDNVVCCYLNGQERVNSSKYTNLPVIRDIASIRTTIKKMIEQTETTKNSEAYQHDRTQLLKDTFGDIPENATEKVVNDIKEYLSNQISTP